MAAVVGAWMKFKGGRKARIKVGLDAIEIEADTTEELSKMLEIARQAQKDMQARVILER